MIPIIIITYNAKDALANCVQSVLNSDAGLPYRLIVVDNGSTDGTADWLKANSADGFEYRLMGSNLGFPQAANVAGRAIKEDMLVFLDDDAAVTPGWLKGLHNAFSYTPNVGIVGCKFVDLDQRIFSAETRCGPLRSLRRWEKDVGQGEYLKETDTLVGACWMMRRELFDTVGDFDEKFFPCQFEDTDYCLRTRLTGYKILYEGSVKLFHKNLLRAGGNKILKANSDYFYQKWHEKLKSFPLPDSHPADKQMSEAIQLIKEKNFAEALDVCDSVRSINPQFVEQNVEMSALLGTGRRAEAQVIARELLLLNPSNFFARFNLLDGQLSSLDDEQKDIEIDSLLDSVERMVRYWKGSKSQ